MLPLFTLYPAFILCMALPSLGQDTQSKVLPKFKSYGLNTEHDRSPTCVAATGKGTDLIPDCTTAISNGNGGLSDETKARWLTVNPQRQNALTFEPGTEQPGGVVWKYTSMSPDNAFVLGLCIAPAESEPCVFGPQWVYDSHTGDITPLPLDNPDLELQKRAFEISSYRHPVN